MIGCTSMKNTSLENVTWWKGHVNRFEPISDMGVLKSMPGQLLVLLWAFWAKNMGRPVSIWRHRIHAFTFILNQLLISLERFHSVHNNALGVGSNISKAGFCVLMMLKNVIHPANYKTLLEKIQYFLSKYIYQNSRSIIQIESIYTIKI